MVKPAKTINQGYRYIYSMIEEPTGRLEIAIKAVLQASHYCEYMRNTSSYTVIGKEDGSPVTIADIGSQLIISHYIKELFPADCIVGEEDDSKIGGEGMMSVFEQYLNDNSIAIDKSEYKALLSKPIVTDHKQPFWTIDPIDGTCGFLRKPHGQYAVCVAYIDQDGQVELSVVSAPRLNDHGIIMWAVRGKGCHMSTLNDLSVSKQITVKKSNVLCVSYEDSHSDQVLVKHVLNHTKLELFKVESQVKYMMVAMGTAVGYLRAPALDYKEKIWDHAPGALLVTEAGGQVTDQRGDAITFSMSGRVSNTVRCIVITGDPHVHQSLLSAIQTK